MERKKLISIVGNSLFAAPFISMGVLACYIMYNPIESERIGKKYLEKPAEIFYQGLININEEYNDAKPLLNEINKGIELASMCAFGTWDPNWKP